MPSEPPSSTALQTLEEARALYRQGRAADGLAFTESALRQWPDDPALWNIRGVFLRQLRRLPEALDALDQALAVEASHAGARLNRGNVLIDMGRVADARPDLEALAADHPQSAPHLLALGRARARTADLDGAAEALRRALAADPALTEAWAELAQAVSGTSGPLAGVAVVDEALAAGARSNTLLDVKASLLTVAGAHVALEGFLREVLAAQPDAAFAHFYLGDLIAARGDPAGETHLRRALELAPGAARPTLALIQQLTGGGRGDEGARLDQALELARPIASRGGHTPYATKVLSVLYARVCDFEAADRLGSIAELAHVWAAAGLHTALLGQLSRVRSDEDRRMLLSAHGRWGEGQVAKAEADPIVRRPRGKADKLRVGLLSADLRRHPVGYFIDPLFEHFDRARMELLAYSLDPLPADALTTGFEARASGFRQLAGATSREAAQAIADDGLDVLIDLGGSTGHNRVEVMAWRPAPRQASYLGYVHSVGLPTIDGLIVDRFCRPEGPDLTPEEPWVLPGSYYVMGPAGFPAAPFAAATAEERLGHITFGTANNPTKYTPETLRLWGEIAAAVPGAHFAVVRREAASAAFRENVTRALAAAGLPPQRIDFHAPGPDHLSLYDMMDISLDPFPLTGGTTTVESLWMGVPVISLRGPGLFERLSWSILGQLGLEDLVAADQEGYRAAALALAANRERRRALHATLRACMQASPLSDGPGFAESFFQLMSEKAR